MLEVHSTTWQWYLNILFPLSLYTFGNFNPSLHLLSILCCSYGYFWLQVHNLLCIQVLCYTLFDILSEYVWAIVIGLFTSMAIGGEVKWKCILSHTFLGIKYARVLPLKSTVLLLHYCQKIKLINNVRLLFEIICKHLDNWM